MNESALERSNFDVNLYSVFRSHPSMLKFSLIDRYAEEVQDWWDCSHAVSRNPALTSDWGVVFDTHTSGKDGVKDAIPSGLFHPQ